MKKILNYLIAFSTVMFVYNIGYAQTGCLLDAGVDGCASVETTAVVASDNGAGNTSFSNFTLSGYGCVGSMAGFIQGAPTFDPTSGGTMDPASVFSSCNASATGLQLCLQGGDVDFPFDCSDVLSYGTDPSTVAAAGGALAGFDLTLDLCPGVEYFLFNDYAVEDETNGDMMCNTGTYADISAPYIIGTYTPPGALDPIDDPSNLSIDGAVVSGDPCGATGMAAVTLNWENLCDESGVAGLGQIAYGGDFEFLVNGVVVAGGGDPATLSVADSDPCLAGLTGIVDIPISCAADGSDIELTLNVIRMADGATGTVSYIIPTADFDCSACAPVACEPLNAIAIGPSCLGYSVCIGYIDTDLDGVGDGGEDAAGLMGMTTDGITGAGTPIVVNDGIFAFDASDDGIDAEDAVGYCYTVFYVNPTSCDPVPYTITIDMTCPDGSPAEITGGLTISGVDEELTAYDYLGGVFGNPNTTAIYPPLLGFVTPAVCPDANGNGGVGAFAEVVLAEDDGTGTGTLVPVLDAAGDPIVCETVTDPPPAACDATGGSIALVVQFNPIADPYLTALVGAGSFACGFDATADVSYVCDNCAAAVCPDISTLAIDAGTDYCGGDAITFTVTLSGPAEGGETIDLDINGTAVSPDAAIAAGDMTVTYTFMAPPNMGCAPVDYTVTIPMPLCADGATAITDGSVAGSADFTVYPMPLTVNTGTGNETACGTPIAILEAADGTACSTQMGVGVGAAATGTCSADTDALDYDFTADIIIGALGGAPAGCAAPAAADLMGTIDCSGCACPTPPSVSITEMNIDLCDTDPAGTATFNYTITNGTGNTVTTTGSGTLSSTGGLGDGMGTITYTPTPGETSPITITIDIPDPDPANPDCSAATASATVTLVAEAVADAGADITATCTDASTPLSATGTGMWSGGAGAFSSVTDPNATYTPAASEAGTTVALTWTVTGTMPCPDATDMVDVVVAPCAGCTLMLGPATVVCDANTAGTDTYTVTIPFDNGAEGAPGAGNYTITTTGIVGGDNPMTTASGTITVVFNEGTPYSYQVEGVAASGANESCDIPISGASPTCESNCTIVASTDNLMCDAGITPEDPSDDEITGYDLTVTATNLTGAGWTAVDGNGATVATGTVGMSTTTITLPAGTAADGSTITITITDDGDGTCMGMTSITLSPCPTIANIPTVGEWGLIILTLLMSITAIVGIRARREEEATA